MRSRSSEDREQHSLLGRVLLIAVVVFGVHMRLLEYLANRSIWFDEAKPALLILDRSFYELLTQPFALEQAVPIGFLLLTKLSVSIAGNSEFVFRFIPLISSFLCFFLLYRLSLKCCRRAAAVLPLFLFAVSYEMVRYASEFKQYSTDVLFALAIPLYATSLLGKTFTPRKGLVFGAFGAAAVWFSFPSVFMTGGAGIALFAVFVHEKKWHAVKNIFVSFLFWAGSLMLNYIFFLRDIEGNPSLGQYWARSFMPLPPFTIKDQEWFIESFLNIFYYPGRIQQALIGLFLFIIGARALYNNRKEIFYILFLPLPLVLIASAFHKYPFEGRVMLFYIPFLYIFMAKGAEALLNGRYLSKAVGMVLLLLILYPALAMASNLPSREGIYREELKPVLNYVKDNKKEEDAIYIYYGAEKAFQYYAGFYGLKDEPYILGTASRLDWEKYKKDLHRLKKEKRVWVIFSHVYFKDGRSEETYMTDYLEFISKRVDSFHATGAAAYLYDFTGQTGH